MKTIINITLGGRNIAIEDTAYDKIKSYTESLRQYYKNEPGRDEIITDIESRFSELMHEKIRKGATYITDADVEEMINTMGRPEDFDKDATAEEGAFQSRTDFKFAEKRRLYRDENNKVIGGVCSGIANWLNVDPTVVRVLFAIISFGGFGSGILAYILLWIFLPTKNLSEYNGKRMFRNPDDKVIGGVAGGMGAYFNTNPSTIRWILAIPLILSALKGIHFFGWDNHFIVPNLFFGGLSGTFIFVYIVLWIVLPEAKSPYEKMEMYGKTIDVNTIKENVQNSMNDVKGRLQNWGKEVQDSAQQFGKKAEQFAGTRGREFGREFNYATHRHSKGIGYVIAMIFKAFFIFIAGTIAISLFVAFLAFLFSGFAFAPINNFLWTSDSQQMWAWGTLLFFVGAPIVGLLVWLIRSILNIRTPGNYLNWMFGGLWAVGWVCLTMFIATLSKDFKRVETLETPVNITQPANGKLILKVSQPALEYKNDFRWINDGREMEGFSLTEDTLKISLVNIEFEKSEDSLYHVMVKKEALGRTDEEALSRVKQIQYNIIAADSVLDLPNGFAISRNSKYRFQNVDVIVQVPVGKSILLDPSVKEKLSSGRLTFNNGRRENNISWTNNDLFRKYRSNVLYTMNKNGKLESADDKEIISSSNNNNYRWDSDESDTAIAPVPPVAPLAPALATDTTNVYRYDAATKEQPNNNAAKETLKKELEQKQKEIDDLKKKLGQ